MPQNCSASPSRKAILAFVAIFLFAMVVYPWLANRFFPNPPAPAPAADNANSEKPPQKATNAKLAAAMKRAGPKPADEPHDKSEAAGKKTWPLARTRIRAQAGEAKPEAAEQCQRPGEQRPTLRLIGLG